MRIGRCGEIRTILPRGIPWILVVGKLAGSLGLGSGLLALALGEHTWRVWIGRGRSLC